MMNPEIPLHLCQVLEEEFEALHGDAAVAHGGAAAGGAESAPADAPRDWLFHEGHVDAERLAAALREAKAVWEDSTSSTSGG